MGRSVTQTWSKICRERRLCRWPSGGAKKDAGGVAAPPAGVGRCLSWVVVGGRLADGPGKTCGKGDSLRHALLERAAVQRLAQPLAALEVAEHGLGQDTDRLVVLGPLQLPLAAAEVFKEVSQP